MTGLFNGRLAPALALHRGFQYGDGVFRTCLIYRGQVLDLEGQLRTLLRDAAGLGLRGAAASLRREATRMARGQDVAVLKLFLLRSGEGRGYRPTGTTADRMLLLYPAPAFPEEHWTRGIALARAPLRLAAQPALAGIKHLNRLEQVLASGAWPNDADELILQDERGHPVGGTRTNLFWVRGGRLCTPKLARCGVAGRMRERVLGLAARAAKLKTAEVDSRWNDLLGADEIFVTNSLIGIWPVRALDRRRWPAPGPVTAALVQALAHPRLDGR